MILGTPNERVKLLRAGVHGRLIEKLYVERNNFKIVCSNALFNLTNDINIRKKPLLQNWTIESQAYLKEVNLSISAAEYENAFIVPINVGNQGVKIK